MRLSAKNRRFRLVAVRSVDSFRANAIDDSLRLGWLNHKSIIEVVSLILCISSVMSPFTLRAFGIGWKAGTSWAPSPIHESTSFPSVIVL